MSVENRGTARRPHWRYAFTIRGVRYRAAIPEARTKYEAERAEAAAKQAVFEGRYGRPTGEHDFVEFVEKVYEPWARANKRSWDSTEKYMLPVIKVRFRGKTFAQISPLLVEKFKRELADSTIKRGEKEWRRAPGSVNRLLEVLSKIFSEAIRAKVTATNPCQEVRLLQLDNRRTRYLTDEEEPRLHAQLVGTLAHLLDLVIVATGTGMRRGDLFNLRKTAVDFQRNFVWAANAKTGKPYPIPMNQEVREIMLRSVRSNPESPYVFVNPETGGPYRCVRKGFVKACKGAGIRDLRWHDLRHTFGTRLGEAGYSEATIAELMGHLDTKTTRRYTHGTERAKREAVEATRPRRMVEAQPATVVSLRK